MGEHKTDPQMHSTYRRKLSRELRLGVVVGLVTAVGFSAFATLAYLVVGPQSDSGLDATSLGAVVGAYLACGLLLGVVYGLLHPLKETLWGSAILGATCGILLYGGVQ